MKYIKQLDSLRAIAVILVIISHWIFSENELMRILGFFGVDIFFVLSGFLITGILLKNKTKGLEIGVNKKQLLKNFYAKRFLRIFPIYYFTIFIVYLFKESLQTDIETSIGYHLSYTSNYYFFKIQGWDRVTAHFWSLSVEEQFYLIWPWIILFLNNKHIKKAIYIFIVIGFISQVLTMNIGFGGIILSNSFDAFGMGGLLAWHMIYKEKNLKGFYKKVSLITIILISIFLIGVFFKLWDIKIQFFLTLFIFWMLTFIILKRDSKSIFFKLILNNKALIFMGKISYGIYLFHKILPSLFSGLKRYLPVISFNSISLKLSYLLWDFAILLLVSWLSFKLLEQPFLRMKKKFKLPDSY